MLVHGGEADRIAAGEVGDGVRVAQDHGEDVAARGVGQRVEEGVGSARSQAHLQPFGYTLHASSRGVDSRRARGAARRFRRRPRTRHRRLVRRERAGRRVVDVGTAGRAMCLRVRVPAG